MNVASSIPATTIPLKGQGLFGHPMSKAAGLYFSSAVVWAVNFIQARQEATSTADLVAMFSVVATVLTALATIIAMLNKTREGSVKELNALLKLEQSKTRKLEGTVRRLEKTNKMLVQQVYELQMKLSKTTPLPRHKKGASRR